MEHRPGPERKGPTGRDVLTRGVEVLSKPLVAWSDAVGEFWGVPGPLATLESAADRLTDRGPRRRGRCSEPSCDQCRDDPHDCRCDCCVVDADLVVNMRVGEQRLVPIVIENPRRREVSVDLQLSPFTNVGAGRLDVMATISPSEFTIEPCGTHTAVLAVFVRSDNPSVDTKAETTDAVLTAQSIGGDIDRCEVFTTDLRVVGCGNRPVRIALAVLPLDCMPFTIECARLGCGCCEN